MKTYLHDLKSKQTAAELDRQQRLIAGQQPIEPMSWGQLIEMLLEEHPSSRLFLTTWFNRSSRCEIIAYLRRLPAVLSWKLTDQMQYFIEKSISVADQIITKATECSDIEMCLFELSDLDYWKPDKLKEYFTDVNLPCEPQISFVDVPARHIVKRPVKSHRVKNHYTKTHYAQYPVSISLEKWISLGNLHNKEVKMTKLTRKKQV